MLWLIGCAVTGDLEAITDHVLSQVDCQVAEVNESGLRGVVAQRDMITNQVAVKLPTVLSIPLLEWNKSSEVSAL